MGMSASPLERITPAFPALAGHGSVQAGREALVTGRSVWPHLAVLTAFWIYVALSNVLYANNMQASLSSMKMEHVFAAWDARLIQHLLQIRAPSSCSRDSPACCWRTARSTARHKSRMPSAPPGAARRRVRLRAPRAP